MMDFVRVQLANHLSRPPILVYQMGKVGSVSISESLRSSGVYPVFHIHRLNPENIQRVREEYITKNIHPKDEYLGKWLYGNIIQRNKPTYFITLIREPISRNISAFFQNFEVFAGCRVDESNISLNELVNVFIDHYPHSVPLTWFDIELQPTLDIDVYDYPFPKDTGYVSITKGNFELLILKSEIDDKIKEESLREFLPFSDIGLMRKNVSKNKDYALRYQEFVRNIKLPPDYVGRMLNSKYVHHFYSDTEITGFWSKWVNRSSNSGMIV